MAFYKQPLHPFDPIVPDDQPAPVIRYFRDDFSGTGHDSFTNPPAQDQAMWQQLLNVMPITQGTLKRRFGYNKLTDLSAAPLKMFEFQRDVDQTRRVLIGNGQPTAGQSNVSAFSEDGTLFATGCSTAAASMTNTCPRCVASRSFAYFYAGLSGSNLKWDGTAVGGAAANVTKWGIDVNDVGNSSFGPVGGTTAANTGTGGAAWQTPNNVLAADANNATLVDAGFGLSDTLQILDFHTLAASGNIEGVQVDVNIGASVNGQGSTFSRPVVFSGTILGTFQKPFINPQYAADGNTSTSSTGTGTVARTRDPETGLVEYTPDPAQETWSGFPAYTGPAPLSITLKIASSATVNTAPSTIQVTYTLDGGVTTHSVYSTSSGRAFTTDSIGLPLTQDLTKIKVTALAECDANSLGTCISTIQDIWVEVTANVQVQILPNTNAQVQLVKAGQAYGDVKSVALSGGTGTPSYITFGGASDLWGGTFTQAEINANNFGIRLQVNNGAIGKFLNIFVDFARIKVFTSGAGVAITSTASAGAVTLTVGRVYYLVFKNSKTGHLSDLSFPSASTLPITNKEITLALPVNQDPQVDTKVILATGDGGDPSVLYLVSEIANATTTYVDNFPDTTIVLNQIYLLTDSFGTEFGVSDNAPPPVGNLAIKHKGRIWMAVGQNLFFSKSVAELTLPNGFIAGKYEEAWPADNYFDISPGAETVTALLSDGSVLYIATERHVRRLFGDSPDNFQEPEIIHQEVGVVNQEVWDTVYMEGAPAGAIWLTPDLRVIGSDFNQYSDIGKPIQDILNTINQSAIQNSHAMFVSQSQYDLYILAVPTGTHTNCDTHLVFDLRTHRWTVWTPTDPSTAMLFEINANGEPEWLFTTPTALMQYDQTALTDNGAVFLTQAKTSWLHLGTPTQRKLLNEMDLVADPQMLVTVEGASTQGEFQAPKQVTFNEPLAQDAFGHYKVFLAGAATNSRYYRFTFVSDSSDIDFIDSYNILAIPVHSL